MTDITTKVNNIISEFSSYNYDDNGNQLSATKTAYQAGVAQNPVVVSVNEYDELNQLVKTTAGTTTVENSYNGEGYRVSKSVNGTLTNYLYEYDKVILEVDNSGVQIARNLYGSNLLMRTVDNQKLYYMYNGHADVTALIDASNGQVVATYYYDAFGNLDPTGTTGNVNNSITYAGYQWDKESGLYYLNARMYDPVTARFLQEDTYTGDPNDPLSLNLYTYCHNEPIMYEDPSGHSETMINGWTFGEDRYINGFQGDIPLDAALDSLSGRYESQNEIIRDPKTKQVTSLKIYNPDLSGDYTTFDVRTSTYKTVSSNGTITSGYYGSTSIVKHDGKDYISIPFLQNISNTKMVKSPGNIYFVPRKDYAQFAMNGVSEDSIAAIASTYFPAVHGSAYLRDIKLSMTQHAANTFDKVSKQAEYIRATTGGQLTEKEVKKLADLGGGFLPSISLEDIGNCAMMFGTVSRVPSAKGTGGGNKYTLNKNFKGKFTAKGTPKTWLDNATKPGDYLNQALKRQGLNSPPNSFKEKWSELGYDFEIRIHPADTKYGKTGSIYRVGRRQQGVDANGQGYGWEYMDETGDWHHTSTLKPQNPGYNSQAAKDTHIQLP